MHVIARGEGRCGEIALRHGPGPDGQPAYEIILNGIFLMASYNRRSEQALAELALAELAHREGLRVLIGGLGMGFTLQAALACPQVARVEVVEIEPLVIAWNRHYFADLNGHALDDPRVHLIQGDVANHFLRTPRCYHAICLDVDNGPTWTVREANARLYEGPMLRCIAAVLRSGGVFTVWAAGRSHEFRQRLSTVFGAVEEISVEDTDPRGEPTTYWIYRARKETGPWASRSDVPAL